MKHLILSFLLLFSTLSATSSWGSGSNTVFLPVRYNQYILSDAIRDLPVNPKLADLLESYQEPIYVTRVHPSYYRYVAYYTVAGYEVAIDFEGFETINFRYYSSVNAIIGFTSTDNVVVLASYKATTP
jgi:hypothetical protein